MNLMITGAVLIDGTGRDPTENAVVVVDDGTIVAAGPAGSIDRPDGDYDEIDAAGGFLLPGLFNMHEHLSYREIVGLPSKVIGDRIVTATIAVRNALNGLSRGWTTVCDMASPYRVAATMRDLIAAGDVLGPRVMAAGTPVSVTGGHATGSGVLCREADGPDAVRAAVRANFRDGADFVKVMASHDPYCMPGHEQTRAEMGLDEIQAAFSEARRWGKFTTSHVMGTEAIANVLDAGVDILHHGTYLDESLAARMVEAGTYFCPTASAYQRQTMNTLFERGGPWADAHDVLVAPHAESLRIAVAAGVKIVNGTDSTGWYAEDVAMLREAGMEPMGSLLACTSVPAAALGLGARLGTVEPGKTADLVVLGSDPLADPYALDDVRIVVAGGIVHDPATLRIETDRSARFVDHRRDSMPTREEPT